MTRTHSSLVSVARRTSWLLAGTAVITVALAPVLLRAQVAPDLGTAARFAVLGHSGVTGSSGSGTVVNGDVGSYPTASISNFPPSTVGAGFTLHLTADAVVQQAQVDAKNAYDFLAAQGGTTIPDALGGTLTPGVYSLGAADLAASTALTLNGDGIFIFNVASTLTINSSSIVTGSANPCNIYWRVGTSATLNGSTFMGNVIADATITVGGGTVLGRVLAGTGSTGAVTITTGGGTIGGCSTPVACPVITLAPVTMPDGLVGTPYSQALIADAGTSPYLYAVTVGTLPDGLTLSPAGLLAGTPTANGAFAFTVRVTDDAGCSLERPYTMNITTPVPTMPEMFLMLLALVLGSLGYLHVRRRSRAGRTPDRGDTSSGSWA